MSDCRIFELTPCVKLVVDHTISADPEEFRKFPFTLCVMTRENSWSFWSWCAEIMRGQYEDMIDQAEKMAKKEEK